MNYHFEICTESLNKKGEELCGDKVEIAKLDDCIISVMSDGLGSGVKANILATLTSKIIMAMLKEGALLDEVVETVVNTLPVCQERDLAYSTFTIIKISISGEAYVVEFDNPGILVLRKGNILPIEKKTRNICGKLIKESRFQMQSGDICINFSDGVVHAGVGTSLNLGWQYKHIVEFLKKSYNKNMTAHSCTRLLLAACENLYQGLPGDDTTVVSCSITNPLPVHIMVGPPVDQEQDQKVVAKLMSGEGKKIVCGGTTSQIVSRITRSPLTAELNYVVSHVPPIGKIKGIDLVTEGIITLGNTLQIVRSFIDSNGKADINLDAQDGASKLAKILLQQCTKATFLIGRALNPAHQNVELPIDLNIKLRIVKDLIIELRKLDKIVEVEYY